MKNMKKIAHSDTVLVEIARKLRFARVKYCVFRGAKIPGKKRKISRTFKSEGFLESRKKYIIAVSILIKHSGLTALVRKGRATSIFPLKLGMGWDCCSRERNVKVEYREK